MSYDLMNIPRPEGAMPGNAGGIKNRLIIFLDEDVEKFPDRDETLTKITEDIVLKSGKYMREMYVTARTTAPKQEKITGDNVDCGGFKVGIEFFRPGLEPKFQEFLAKFGTGFSGYVLFEDSVNKTKYLLGEPGNPATFLSSALEWGGSIDGGKKGSTNAFEANQSLPIAEYQGALTLETTSSPEVGTEESAA